MAAGNTVMEQEKGSVHNAQQMEALARELDSQGFTHTAKGIRAMEKQGKGFDFVMTRDGEGNITGFQATGGAKSKLL